MSNALFFTFEGGEGSGKTTLIERLRETLTADGYQTIVAREPGGTPLGERIRDLLLNTPGMTIAPKAECLLFLASRLQQIEQVIKPALAAGKVVLCDRYNDSTVAYQGVARGLGFEKIGELCDFVCEGFSPSLTFYLDIDPIIGLKRAGNARQQDRLEQEALLFHQKVREGFLEIGRTDPERLKIIDASRSKEEVFQEVYQLIKRQPCFRT